MKLQPTSFEALYPLQAELELAAFPIRRRCRGYLRSKTDLHEEIDDPVRHWPLRGQITMSQSKLRVLPLPSYVSI